MAGVSFDREAVTFSACFNFRELGTMEQFVRELRSRHGSVRALLEAGGAPAAALDRLVDDLVDRATE